MDFASLLAEHQSEQGGGGSSGAPALDRALSAPREAGSGDQSGYGGFAPGHHDDGGGGGRRRGGRRRGGRRSGGRDGYYEDFAPQQAVQSEELEPGTFRFIQVWGDYPKWDTEEWFSEEPGDIVVQFRAKGEDNIVVGLSSKPRLNQEMYEIVIGGWRDTKSVIRREPQGVERALATQPRLCSDSEFRWYWAMLKRGVVSVGVGEQPGRGVILAWKDPDPIPAQYASFTTWDHTVTYKDIRVAPVDTDMELEDVELNKFVPEFMQKLEAERALQRERAARLGGTYVEPSAEALASQALTPLEQAQLKRATMHAGDSGFVTGFDPTTEEERKKAEERAKRFGVEAKPEGGDQTGEDGPEDIMAREKREARASRFGMQVLEDEEFGQALVRDLSALSVPRKDPGPEDMTREEVLHVYGNFTGLFTQNLMGWAEEYGPSHVEWLHDCGANLVFGDAISAKRAMMGLCRPIPDIKDLEEVVTALRDTGYVCATLPLGGIGADGKLLVRYFLVRKAAATDVKATEPQYRTVRGFGRGAGRAGGGRFRDKRMRDLIRRKAAMADEVPVETITGVSRKREDSDDGEAARAEADGAMHADAAGEAGEGAKRQRMAEEDDEEDDE